MNAYELIQPYIKQNYPNDIVAVYSTSYDGDFDVIVLEKGKEIEFYKFVMYKQTDLYNKGEQIDTSGGSIELEESVLNFVNKDIRAELIKDLIKSCYWRARVTGKNKHLKYKIQGLDPI